MEPKKYYIKKRINPQFDKPYYIACGQLSKTAAKKGESPLYGYNTMLPYDTEEEYKAALRKFEKDGFSVR